MSASAVTAPRILRAEQDFAGRQTLGTRPNQEDAYGVVPPEDFDSSDALLVVVADGMGGHAAGEVASEMAVEAFVDGFFRAPEAAAPERLWTGLELANSQVAAAIAQHPELEGMGTTVTALLISENQARWISVGDSPLYLIRNGNIKLLNHLHLAQVESATEEEQADLEPRHVLVSAVIGESLYEVDDQPPVALQEGDVLVVASDGLNTLPDSTLLAHVAGNSEANAAERAEALLQAVLHSNRPNQDNATVVVVLWR